MHAQANVRKSNLIKRHVLSLLQMPFWVDWSLFAADIHVQYVQKICFGQNSVGINGFISKEVLLLLVQQ